jgi:hypothetical protein
MSEIKFSNFVNEDGSHGPDLVGVTTFTSPHYFVPPSGTTAQRPSGEGLAPGMLRFNTDIGRLEVWRGDHWATILGESPSLDGGARGLFFGGSYNVISYITISSLGNAIDFGDLTARFSSSSAVSSSTRGVNAGGEIIGSPFATVNTIEYVTISSTGNSLDFGDLTQITNELTGCSSNTRGIFAGGRNPSPSPSTTNIINYITISTTGNAVDFGDLLSATNQMSGCSSSTRGIFAGGSSGPSYINVIQYVTISTTGNTSDFGDLTQQKAFTSSCSNSTRGIFGGGIQQIGPAIVKINVIDSITIASTGNSYDFGDLTAGKAFPAACSSSTRGIFAGGATDTPSPGTSINNIDYVTILSLGNAQDFGDLLLALSEFSSCSNGHGGL